MPRRRSSRPRMEPSHQIAVTALLALIAGAAVCDVALVRPYKAEAASLRAELSRMQIEQTMLRKQLTNLATASSRQKKPSQLLAALANNSIPTKQRVMSPSKAKAARERNTRKKQKKALERVGCAAGWRNALCRRCLVPRAFV